MRRPLPVFLVPILVAACGLSTSDESTLYEVLSRGQLIVGLEAEFRPFEYVDENGEIIGFDVDIVRELAKELGVELRLQNLKWQALPDELVLGKIDVICSGMTATLERARKVSFSDPYFETGLCLLLHRGTADEVRHVDDLNDPKYRIVVKTGTTGDHAARDRLPKARILKLEKEGICALEVSQGKADAFVYDQHSVILNQRRYAETTRAILTPFTYEPYSMGIRKGDLDWWAFLNQFIRQIKKDGRYNEIHARYFGDGPDDGEK